jgi:uncharacterized protein (DUF1800 family)
MTTDTIVTADVSPVSPLALIGLGVLAVAQSACQSSSSSGEGSSPPVRSTTTITSMALRDAAGNPLMVNGVTGTAAGVRFNLDGGSAANSRPADPGIAGAEQDYSFVASAKDGSATIDITINPDPSEVAKVLRGSLLKTRAALAAIAFPPSWDELMGYAGLTHGQLVERMLSRLNGQPHEPYPAWIDEQILSTVQYDALPTNADREAYDQSQPIRRQEFKAWFFRQMVTSPDPLSERLLLFWHNLFTSSAENLVAPQLIARQHRLYRQRIGGNLRTFLKAMCQDAGMCEYLDNSRNRKGKPNENFARELLELFTFGVLTVSEAYAESDIPIVARCFTGYGVDANKNFSLKENGHDMDDKVLWGVTRKGAVDDGLWVIDQILAKKDANGHSYCAIHIVTRLWDEFIGDADDNKTAIIALADKFAGEFAWDLLPLYRALFTHPAFVMVSRIGTRVRAPVELYASYFRALGITPDRWDENLLKCSYLDQDLLDPPNVFGWPGGTNWITVKTYVDRREYMSLLGVKYRERVPERLINVLDILMLAADPINGVSSDPTAGGRALDYVADPAFNLR